MRTHSDAFVCIHMHFYAFKYTTNIHCSLSYLVVFCSGLVEKPVVEKVARVTRATHRPRNTVAGNRIQPRDDTVEEEGDGEEPDEDLDGM